jgi:hypothetical protein
MAVAAAIGVGGDDLDADRRGTFGSRQKLLNQKQVSTTPSRNSSNVGEINRSIEKMSLGSGCQATSTMESTASPKGALPAVSTNSRRDSNWTSVSTEGYGSMRSSDPQSGVSRRASELSALSQVSEMSFLCLFLFPDHLLVPRLPTCPPGRT